MCWAMQLGTEIPATAEGWRFADMVLKSTPTPGPRYTATLHVHSRSRNPESGRIAVKVINHLGDEVMKVFRVD